MRLLSTLILTVASATALAQSFPMLPPPPKGLPPLEDVLERAVAQKFASADTDHDGKLTLGEAKTGMPPIADNFDMIDTGKNGYITLDQLKTALKNDEIETALKSSLSGQ